MTNVLKEVIVAASSQVKATQRTFPVLSSDADATTNHPLYHRTNFDELRCLRTSSLLQIFFFGVPSEPSTTRTVCKAYSREVLWRAFF